MNDLFQPPPDRRNRPRRDDDALLVWRIESLEHNMTALAERLERQAQETTRLREEQLGQTDRLIERLDRRYMPRDEQRAQYVPRQEQEALQLERSRFRQQWPLYAAAFMSAGAAIGGLILSLAH